MGKSELARSFLLGITAGMRSQMPLALVAYAARQGQVSVGSGQPWRWLRSSKIGAITGVLAMGELVGDKLPATPSRLEPGPLGGRLVIGAVAGAAVMPGNRRSRALGALLGVVGAATGAYGGYQARALLGRSGNLPDPFWGVVEDGVAVGISGWALRR